MNVQRDVYFGPNIVSNRSRFVDCCCGDIVPVAGPSLAKAFHSDSPTYPVERASAAVLHHFLAITYCFENERLLCVYDMGKLGEYVQVAFWTYPIGQAWFGRREFVHLRFGTRNLLYFADIESKFAKRTRQKVRVRNVVLYLPRVQDAVVCIYINMYVPNLKRVDI